MTALTHKEATYKPSSLKTLNLLDIHPEACTVFRYEELKEAREEATDGFPSPNLLGKASFGPVYKGIIAGNLVAVKQLKIGREQCENQARTEAEIVSRVHHRHLVSLPLAYSAYYLR